MEKRLSTTNEFVSDDYRDGSVRHPSIRAKQLIIHRGSVNPPSSGTSTYDARRRSSAMPRFSVSSSDMGVDAFRRMSSTGVTAVKESREQEKKDMQGLNERLANYIERVRFYEAQNRKLADELEKLKNMWGKETQQIKDMYQAELDEARRLLEAEIRLRSHLELRKATIEELAEELRHRLEDALKDAADAKEKFGHQNQQLSDLEGEVGLLRRRLASLESERDKEKGLIKKLQDALNATRSDLDNETLLHIDAENRRQTLEEELEFLKALHEQELKELQALAYRDSTAENREYWKTEMGQALREIQEAYDDKMDVMRGELETYYNLKLQEFRTGATRNNMESVHFKEESKRLRDQMQAMRDKLNDAENKLAQCLRELDQLRREKEERERELEHRNGELSDQVIKLQAEMEAMLRELQMIIDAKLGLELEIITYRRLLEGEESRAGLRQITDNLLNSESNEYTIRQTESTSGVSITSTTTTTATKK